MQLKKTAVILLVLSISSASFLIYNSTKPEQEELNPSNLKLVPSKCCIKKQASDSIDLRDIILQGIFVPA